MTNDVNLNEQSMLKRALAAVKSMKAQVAALQNAQHEPIAIIGMACRFPGNANTPDAYWQLLRDGIDAIVPLPSARQAKELVPQKGQGDKPFVNGSNTVEIKIPHAGFLTDVDAFDPSFFGISPRETVYMDPQHRLLLEVTWEAFESAGIDPESLFDSDTGVFVGMCANSYEKVIQRHYEASTDIFDLYQITRTSPGVAAGRIAYAFGFIGPAFTVDTACSSSLTSVHQACRSLYNDECTLAIAGGAHLLFSHEWVDDLALQGSPYAADNRCKTFDAAGDGFARGEGCGMIVLKRLSAAEADGDRIFGVIRSSMINQDGRSSGLSAPSGPSQQQLIRRALKEAGLTPDQVSYVEAHGTGTKLGDPVEVGALNAVFGQRREPLWVGSAKTNFGHLEGAAGIAGLMKTVLMLQHKQIPPHLHFQTPNPNIDWEDSPIQIPFALTEWHPATSDSANGSQPAKRIAGVSSFGISGTNAHIIVEEAPQKVQDGATQTSPTDRSWHLLTLAAKTQESLVALAEKYRHFLTQTEGNTELDLGDLCFTGHIGRSHFAHRLSIPTNSVTHLQKMLEDYLQDAENSLVAQGNVPAYQSAPSIAFLFTGQGSQYIDMGRELYQTEPIFRAVIDRSDEAFQAYFGRSLLALIYPAETPDHNDLMKSHPCGQAANFAIECALADLWRSWGVQPDIGLGHSLGDFAAAYVAGVISLEDGVRLVTARGRLMERAQGSMVSTLASEAEVAPLLAEFDDVAIGVINGPQGVVISGGHDSVAAITNQLQEAGFKTRQLEIPVAAHSPLLDPVLDEFEQAIHEIDLSTPQIPVVSSMTGQLVTDELTDPTYWRQHLRDTVRFADGVNTLQEQGIDLLIEIGPGATLLGMAQTIYAHEVAAKRHLRLTIDEASSLDATPVNPKSKITNPLMLPSLRGMTNDWQQMVSTLGELYVHGVAIDWVAFDNPYPRQKVTLPTYAFQRQHYWMTDLSDKRQQALSDNPMVRLIEEGDVQALQQMLNRDQQLTEDEQRLQSQILHSLIDCYRASESVHSDVNAGTIYDAFFDLGWHMDNQAESGTAVGDQTDVEMYLSFGIFPDIVPGFSWIQAPMSYADDSAQFGLMEKAQLELRRCLFAHVDFHAMETVLDFGCGHGADLIRLAETYPHLSLDGFTISAKQAQFGNKRLVAKGLHETVTIRQRDSAVDPFPAVYDLMFGIEVAAHISDKEALFDNIQQHLKPGGKVVLADYLAHTQDMIEDEVSSTYMVTQAQWVQLCSSHRLKVVACMDISQEVANYTYIADLEAELTELYEELEQARSAMQSFNQTQHLLTRRLASYLLITLAYDPESPPDALATHNQSMFEQIPTYVELTPKQWLYELEWQPRPNFGQRPDYLAAPAAIASTLREEEPALLTEHRAEHYGQAMQALEALCIDYILAAFAKVGFTFQAGDRWQLHLIAQRISVIPRYNRLLARLLAILTEAGILQQEGDEWLVLRTAEPAAPALDDLRNQHGELLDAELTLLARCGDSLTEVMRGLQEPLELLFPQGEYEDVKRFYTEAPSARVLSTLLQRALQKAIAALPAGQGVRIVEIGAGTGSATAGLLPHLPREQTEYLFTDIGQAFLTQARDTFSDYPFISYQLLDIEQSPVTQGFALQQADIVIAANVLHATRDLSATLTHVRQLLKPSGLLLLVEGTTRSRFVDLTFGLTEGWWRFDDTREDHPLLTFEAWRQQLHANGYQNVSQQDARVEQTIGQTVIVAQAKDEVLAAGQRSLIFADREGLGQALARRLHQAGDHPILVYPDTNYQQVDENIYHIQPDVAADYTQLLADISQISSDLHHVIHLWNLDLPPMDSSDDLVDMARLGCGTALQLVQALLQQQMAPPALWLITEGVQATEQIAEPAPCQASTLVQSTLWGMGKVVALEHPELNCTLVDLDRDHADLHSNAEHLFTEIRANSLYSRSEDARESWRENQIALHEGKRYVPRLTRFDAPNGQTIECRPDATYLITGGMGGIGLEVAEWFVEQGAQSLILLGRSEPQPIVQDRIAAMRDRGVNVTVAQADVTDLAAVTNVLNQIDTAYPLRGIVHAVGVLDDAPLLQQNWERFASVLAPKVQGAWNLHRVTEEMRAKQSGNIASLDFFVLFSSVVGLLGNQGQANHAAANAFLDTFAHHRRANHLPALSINWGAWAEVGAAAERVTQNHQQMRTAGMGVISPTQGLECFAQLLAQENAQVGVIPILWSRYLASASFVQPLYEKFNLATSQQIVETAPAMPNLRQQLLAYNVEGRLPLLLPHLQKVTARVLAIPDPNLVMPEQGLIDMGMDSLMAIELRNHLGRLLDETLPATLIYDYPTLTKIGTFIVESILAAKSDTGQSDRAQSDTGQPGMQQPAPEDALVGEENSEEIVQAEATSLTTNGVSDTDDGSTDALIQQIAAKYQTLQ